MGKPKEKRQPEKIDLSRISKRYVEIPVHKHIRAKFYTYNVTRAWENTGKTITNFMEKIGNIKSAWHGTKPDSITDIASEFLRLGWRGAFGGGIYTSPELGKALGYIGYDGKGYILEVKVALGREFHPQATGNYENLIRDGEYDSVVAMSPFGMLGWMGRNLAPAEYVVFKTEQVAIQKVYEIGSKSPDPWDTSYKRQSEDPPWKRNHPCKKCGFLCANACNPLKSMRRICIIGKRSAFCKDYKKGSKIG